MIFARKNGSQTTNLVTWRSCVSHLVLSFIVMASGQQRIDNEAFRTPWIPKHFLSDYTFNAADTCPSVGGGLRCDQRTGSQCLVLDDATKVEICNGAISEDKLGRVHPRFCVHHSLNLVLDQTGIEAVLNQSAQCRAVLDGVDQTDLQALRLACEFQDVLGRYDCSEGYSVNWNCTACMKAYRAWVCSMLLPVYTGGGRLVKPCRSFCHQVEQRCPYFSPFIKEQYAGEPAFKCIDRNIPDIPSITPNTAYGRTDMCYHPCHLDADLEATACNLSSIPTEDETLSMSGNHSGTVSNLSSPAGRPSIRPATVVVSLLLWWALGFRQDRTKRHLWREPT